jgi:hypothetical protein
MHNNANRKVRALTGIMALRVKPEILSRDIETPNAEVAPVICSSTVGGSLLLHRRAPTGTDGQKCYICHGPAEAERLNRDCLEATGFVACKACIDDALATIYGTDTESLALVRRVLNPYPAAADE